MKKLEINKDLIKIIIGTCLFIIGYFTHSIIVYVFIYALISIKVYANAFKNFFHKNFFDENILMILATLGAFYIGKYPEAVLVMLLYSLGEYLSEQAVNNSKNEIINLMDLRSDKIYIKDIGQTKVENARIGDVFIVKPGEKIALDGQVLSGESHIDTSSLTGESTPRLIKKNMTVLSGTINLDSILEVKATSTFQTSTASKLINIMENSEDKKSQTEKFITKFSKIYTPIVVLIAIFICSLSFFLNEPFDKWLYRALEILVISCPCALVISVPLGYFAGIGRCSKEKILVKGMNELENLSKVQTMIFDKTGTITKGNFTITKVCSKNCPDEYLVELVATAEISSNHPIASSILAKYGQKVREKAKKFQEIKGEGISCQIKNKQVLVGNHKLMIENEVKCPKVKELGTVLYVAEDSKYLGYIVIGDELKCGAEETFTNLKDLKIKTILLSGDNNIIVKDVAQRLQISKYYGELLPENKVNILKKEQEKNPTGFVGDGINDAPVIKLSDCGIAMGGIGSDATIEASDVVVMKDELEDIIKGIKISKLTRNIVKMNIIFAMCFKILMLFLAAFGITSIWLAVFADVGVTLLSVINSLRIFYKKLS